MTNVVPFSFESQSIRTLNLDGNPWFVGKDVCNALGYKNPNKAMGDHCRGVTKRYPIVDSLGRTQEVRIIAEPDTYRLIASSHLPEAQRFEAWLFEEVLPTIRKTGSYVAPQAATKHRDLKIRDLAYCVRVFTLSRDLWSKQQMLFAIKRLCKEMNLPMPPAHLLGKPAEQYQLEI